MRHRTDADVIVVGAGILGVSVAHHLQQRGTGPVILVDADTPSAATSGAGAGFVGLWAAGYANFFTAGDLELEQYGIDFYRRLAAQDPDVEVRSNGNLFVGTSDEGHQQWVASVLEHPLAPPGTRALSAAEVADVTGGVLAEGSVVGGALHPGGIQLSAGRGTRVVAQRFVEAGGQLRSNTRCAAVLTTDGQVSGVRTEGGDLYADAVVLACGAWSNRLLEPFGYQAPLLRMVATRVISPPSAVPASMPTVMVPDHYGLWVREHRGGLTWGNGSGYAPLFELGGSLDSGGQPRREELVERLDVSLTPQLRKLIPDHDLSIGWWLQGVPCMTPDRRFLAGAVPDVQGLYLLTGDNEAGVTHGPGLGRLVADVVLDGSSEWVDPTPYRPDRFTRGQFDTEQAVLAAMPVRR